MIEGSGSVPLTNRFGSLRPRNIRIRISNTDFSGNESLNVVALQVLSTRKRKDVAEADVKVQVCLFGFDLLYLNGESLVTRPFQVRSNKGTPTVISTWVAVCDPFFYLMRFRIRRFSSMRI
jgi:hypothetical protein